MRQILKYTGYILVLLIVGFLLYKFYYIIGWLLIAAIISFIGEPLVKFFDKAHIKKIYLPAALTKPPKKAPILSMLIIEPILSVM